MQRVAKGSDPVSILKAASKKAASKKAPKSSKSKSSKSKTAKKSPKKGEGVRVVKFTGKGGEVRTVVFTQKTAKYSALSPDELKERMLAAGRSEAVATQAARVKAGVTLPRSTKASDERKLCKKAGTVTIAGKRYSKSVWTPRNKECTARKRLNVKKMRCKASGRTWNNRLGKCSARKRTAPAKKD